MPVPAQFFIRILSVVSPLLLGAPSAQGQGSCSNIVGFEVVTIFADTTTMLAPRLQETTLASGTFDAVNGAELTDSTNDFTSLDPSLTYVVELESGSSNGEVLDLVSFTATTFTVSEAGLAAVGDSYQIRTLSRLSEFFNPAFVPEMNTVSDFNPESGDLIYVPDGSGGLRQYFYSTYTDSAFAGPTGFYNAATGEAEDPIIRYTDALLYLRRGPEFFIVFDGVYKEPDTRTDLIAKFSYLGSVYDLQSLDDLDLAATVQAGSPATADVLWSQDTVTGGLNAYFYSDGSEPGLTTGWRLLNAFPANADDDRGSDFLSSGMVLNRRGGLPQTIRLVAPVIPCP